MVALGCNLSIPLDIGNVQQRKQADVRFRQAEFEPIRLFHLRESFAVYGEQIIHATSSRARVGPI